jgi:serine protease Do
VQITELTPALAQELGVRANTPGVVVVALRPGSSAAEAGLRRGDIIQELNHQPIRTLLDFERVSRAAGSSALLLIRRANQSLYIAITRS